MAYRRHQIPHRVMTAAERATIGHNMGPPLDSGASWGMFVWRQAHKKAWKSPPIEVVRQRSRRAEALGLTYRELTAMILNSGSHVPSLVFWLGSDWLHLRRDWGPDGSRSRLELAPTLAARLQRPWPSRVQFVFDVPASYREAGDPAPVLQELCGPAFAGCRIWGQTGVVAARAPREAGRVIRELLASARLTPGGAILIGDGERARAGAEAALLPLFIPAAEYFSRP